MRKRITEHILIIKEWKFQKKKNLEECLFATGGKKEIKSDLNTRKSGSAALDIAYVAAGRYDGYFQNYLNLWDIAAGIIIVKEAGGKINEIEKFVFRSKNQANLEIDLNNYIKLIQIIQVIIINHVT